MLNNDNNDKIYGSIAISKIRQKQLLLARPDSMSHYGNHSDFNINTYIQG